AHLDANAVGVAARRVAVGLGSAVPGGVGLGNARPDLRPLGGVAHEVVGTGSHAVCTMVVLGVGLPTAGGPHVVVDQEGDGLCPSPLVVAGIAGVVGVEDHHASPPAR